MQFSGVSNRPVDLGLCKFPVLFLSHLLELCQQLALGSRPFQLRSWLGIAEQDLSPVAVTRPVQGVNHPKREQYLSFIAHRFKADQLLH